MREVTYAEPYAIAHRGRNNYFTAHGVAVLDYADGIAMIGMSIKGPSDAARLSIPKAEIGRVIGALLAAARPTPGDLIKILAQAMAALEVSN